MAGPLLTPDEWHAARARLGPAPPARPRSRAALPGAIALILATLDIRPGGA